MPRLIVAFLSGVRRAAVLGRRIGRRQIFPFIVAAIVLLGEGDGGSRIAQAAPRRPKPWFDAKGVFAFPLGYGPLPLTRDALTESMTEGWKRHVRFPEGGDVVNANGGWYPALGNLRIQLSNGVVDTNRDLEKDPRLRPSGKVEGRVAVRKFDLDAHPLVIDKAKLDLHITATDARIDLEHDEHGRPMMMLADASIAAFQFQASNEDLERVLISDLNEVAEKHYVKIKKARLKITAVNNRSIDVDVNLATEIVHIPAGLHFQAHVDIDNDMYAKLSHLKCDGDKALGPLITKLIEPGLKKYEGKSRLIFGFPTGDLKVKDVTIQGGEDVRLGATFTR